MGVETVWRREYRGVMILIDEQQVPLVVRGPNGCTRPMHAGQSTEERSAPGRQGLGEPFALRAVRFPVPASDTARCAGNPDFPHTRQASLTFVVT